jgi:hypothetical protein
MLADPENRPIESAKLLGHKAKSSQILPDLDVARMIALHQLFFFPFLPYAVTIRLQYGTSAKRLVR